MFCSSVGKEEFSSGTMRMLGCRVGAGWCREVGHRGAHGHKGTFISFSQLTGWLPPRQLWGTCDCGAISLLYSAFSGNLPDVPMPVGALTVGLVQQTRPVSRCTPVALRLVHTWFSGDYVLPDGDYGFWDFSGNGMAFLWPDLRKCFTARV